MIYLFIGEDELLKQEKIQLLKKQLFSSSLESFNYEVFYAAELTLPRLRESLSRFSVSSTGRLLVIRDALKLKNDGQEYFLDSFKTLPANLTIVFDILNLPKEESPFLNRILKIAKVVNFKIKEKVNAFDLARAIERKQPDSALGILGSLFKAGEKAERILGALRYRFTKPSVYEQRAIKPVLGHNKNIKLLLEADINLKTGKMRQEFVLETLVVKLCL